MKEGHNIFFDEKVQRFQNKVDKYFTHFLGGSKSFLLLFVYEHAHLTAEIEGVTTRIRAPLCHVQKLGEVNRRLARGEERSKFSYVVSNLQLLAFIFGAVTTVRFSR